MGAWTVIKHLKIKSSHCSPGHEERILRYKNTLQPIPSSYVHSRRWVDANHERVVVAYRRPDSPTIMELSREFRTSAGNISDCLKQDIPWEEYMDLKKIRRVRSKTGNNNPNWGKSNSR